MIKLSHFQSTPHLMQYTYRDFFSPLPKQFLNTLILMPLSASTVFLFYLFHIGKMVPFKDFFHLGKQKTKCLGARSGEWGGWGIGVMLFLVKNCWTLSLVWAGTLINHPSWNGQMRSVFKKNSLKLNAASHTTTSWYTDTDASPEFLPSTGSLYYKGPTLQKIWFLGGSPLVC